MSRGLGDVYKRQVQDKAFINRSAFPLFLTHGPAILIGKYFSLKPLQILLLSRIQMTALSWIVEEWCLYRLIPTKHERIKATLLAMTSYLTLVHQSHTLSNSTETILLLPTLYIINDIRSYLEMGSDGKRKAKLPAYSSMKLVWLGLFISIGTFNRITFCAWLIAPAYYLLRYFLACPTRALIPIISFALTTSMIIYVDSIYYDTLPHLTIAPLNNLIYNTASENLAKHGLHSRFTHIFVNYPQIVGPLLLLIFPFAKSYTATTTFLSIISGIFTLSIFPHQELRFLLPAVPLLSTVVSFGNPRFNFLNKYYRHALSLWMVYTTLLTILYGLFHQAGVIPAIVEISEHILIPDTSTTTIVFWRTYPPPTWMLNPDFKDPVYVNKGEKDHIDVTTACGRNSVITLMGASVPTLRDVYSQLSNCPKGEFQSNTLLVAPRNAMLNVDNYETIWENFWHLDMDHFEYDIHGMDTFAPGIGIYKLH